MCRCEASNSVGNIWWMDGLWPEVSLKIWKPALGVEDDGFAQPPSKAVSSVAVFGELDVHSSTSLPGRRPRGPKLVLIESLYLTAIESRDN